MKQIKLLFIISVLSLTCLSQTIQKHGISLPVLDKTKSYPPKKIEYDTKVTYVPLETSKEVLLGEGCKLNYVSTERIILSDAIRGDVFIFDKNGKILSKFNQKGPLGYIIITYIAYDEANNELFILDNIKKKVFVYFQSGTLLRSFNIPQNTCFMEIYNFDDNTLLALDEDRNGSNKPIKPYVYIAKSDGKIAGYVSCRQSKVNPTRIEGVGKDGASSLTITHSGIPDNCKFGNDFFLANKSMDTIYCLKKDKTLIPILTQTPSVYSEHPTAISVGMVTDQFLMLCVSSYDIKEGVRALEKGDRWRPKFKNYILDRKTGEFFGDLDKGKYSVFKIDTPKNQDYRLMQAFNLINANKKGILKGKLKEIASKLDIGDNPVIEIRKFK